MRLTVENVIKRFGERAALNNVSLSLDSGIVGLLGPNGAGKSTLMRLIATVDRPTSGTIPLLCLFAN